MPAVPSSTPPALPTGPLARRGALATGAVLVACAVACSLPLLVGGGVLASVGAFAGGAQAAGLALLAAAALGAVWWVRRRRARSTESDTSSSCGCGGACGDRCAVDRGPRRAD